VLGPLPRLYRIIVSICALAAFIGFGAWLTAALPGPLLAPAGAGIGAALGLCAVLLLLHDFERPRRQEHRIRRG
jgi:ABC-type Fe3+-siderophore transport system permease subunit